MREDFETALGEKTNEVNSILKESFNMMKLLPQKKVADAMEYSVLLGGKRLRPILMNEVYKMYGGTGREIVYFMTAIEMVHTYSLIHDDLPAMDNDDIRRGKPTNHKVYGEDVAILAGDGLLNLAFETAFKAFDVADQRRLVVDALKVFAEKTGVLGMVGGQMLDIELEKKEQPGIAQIEEYKKSLERMYLLKTGCLLEASMMIGAILAGAGEKEVKRMSMVARRVGLAFQIQDDILDITGDQSVIGKPVGSDEKNNKITYPALIGIKESKEEADSLILEAQKLLSESKASYGFVSDLINYLMDRNK